MVMATISKLQLSWILSNHMDIHTYPYDQVLQFVHMPFGNSTRNSKPTQIFLLDDFGFSLKRNVFGDKSHLFPLLLKVMQTSLTTSKVLISFCRKWTVSIDEPLFLMCHGRELVQKVCSKWTGRKCETIVIVHKYNRMKKGIWCSATWRQIYAKSFMQHLMICRSAYTLWRQCTYCHLLATQICFSLWWGVFSELPN